MRVLVTGAGGYVGSAVVLALVAAGHEPIAMVRGDSADAPAGVEVRVADLGDSPSLSAAVVGTEAVCHLAGLTRARDSWDRPLDYFATNVGGLVELLRALHSSPVTTFVLASTGAIYGTPDRQPISEDLPDAPMTPYASSKAAAESVLGWEAARRGLAAVSLRLFNVAGRADPDPTRVVPRVLAARATAREFTVNGDGTVVRDYLHVDDAAEAFVAALEHPPPPGAMRKYNIGNGNGASILDLVAAVEKVTGHAVELRHAPPAQEPQSLVCDRRRAAEDLHWVPRKSDLATIVRDAWGACG